MYSFRLINSIMIFFMHACINSQMFECLFLFCRCCLAKAIDRTGVMHFFSKSFNKQKKNVENVSFRKVYKKKPLLQGGNFMSYYPLEID